MSSAPPSPALAQARAPNDVVAYITRSYTDNGSVSTRADANLSVSICTYDAFDCVV